MAIQKQLIEYTHDDTLLEGYMAWDDSISGKRPAVLIAHAWAGRDEFVAQRAEELAANGYVGFALDMYGKGKRGYSVAENSALMTPLVQDRALLQARMALGLAVARQQDQVAADQVAAIGFCFGGLCVLDLARTGADLKGVASFHGSLGTSTPAAGSCSRVSSTSIISRFRVGLMALRFSGRLRMTQPMPSSISTFTVCQRFS